MESCQSVSEAELLSFWNSPVHRDYGIKILSVTSLPFGTSALRLGPLFAFSPQNVWIVVLAAIRFAELQSLP